MRAASSRRHAEPHAIQPEQKQTSKTANFHYTPQLQTIPRFGVFGFWGQISNHICVLLLYVWVGRKRCGTEPADEGERKGGLDFCWKHNWHGPRDVVCQSVQCSCRAPQRFIKRGEGPLKRCLCSLCGASAQWGAHHQHRWLRLP